MKKILLLLIAIVLAITPAFAQIVTVFEEGMSGYAGYRIPAIIKASDGSLIAFAEARKNGKGDTGNIDLVMRKSFDNGRTWGAMKVIWDDADNTCGNPVPVVVGNDIALVATWNLGSDKEKFIEQNSSKDTRRVYVFYSHDNGDNWSEPKEITNEVKKAEWGWYATGPCHGIVKQLNPHKGRIVIPCNHSEINGGKPESHSHLIYSDDEGENWSLGAVTKINGNESSVVELSNGKLMLNMRRSSSADSVRYFAVSNDGGQTFSKEGKAKDLIEPRCQGSVLNFENNQGKPSKRLIFSNPADASKRINLSLRVSTNNGKTWKYFKQVYADRSAYSDIVQLDSERVGVLFENGDGKETYRRISFSEVCLNHEF
jgi:sialidase-1